MSSDTKPSFHIEFSQSGKLIHKCIACSYVSEYSSNLNRHLSDHHFGSGPIPSYCRFCLEKFATQLELKEHMKIHDGDLSKSKRGVSNKRKAETLIIDNECMSKKVIFRQRRALEPESLMLKKIFKKSDAVVYKGQLFQPSDLLLKTSLDNQYVMQEKPGTSSKINQEEAIINPINNMMKFKVLKNTEFVKKSGVLFPVNDLKVEDETNPNIPSSIIVPKVENSSSPKLHSIMPSKSIRVIPQNIQPLDLETILSGRDGNKKPIAGKVKKEDSNSSNGIGKYKSEYETIYPGIQPSIRGDSYFYCTICQTDLLLSTHGGSIQRHVLTMSHIDNARRLRVKLPMNYSSQQLPQHEHHQTFKKEYSKMFPGITASEYRPNFFYCLFCDINRPLGYRAFDMIKRHVETEQHQQSLPKAYRKNFAEEVDETPSKQMQVDEELLSTRMFGNDNDMFSIVKMEPPEEMETDDIKDPSLAKILQTSCTQQELSSTSNEQASNEYSTANEEISDFVMPEIKKEMEEIF